MKDKNIFESRFLFRDPEGPSAGMTSLPAENPEQPSPSPEHREEAPSASEEREKLRMEIEEQQKLALEQVTGGIAEWKIGTVETSAKFNPETWNMNSKEALNKTKNEWAALGLPVNNAFYKKIFENLGHSSDPTFLAQQRQTSAELEKIYRDPLNNMENLGQCDDEFVSSVRFFAAVKDMVLNQNVAQVGTEKNVKEGDEDPIYTKAVKAVQDNGRKLTEALRNKDYPTAAMYVIGIYAMYKAYKSLPDANKGTLKKVFFWSAALYSGSVFAKNAGFDVLKKIGLKAEDAEVEGTPLAAIKRLGIPEVDKLENLDAFRDISFVNLKPLYDEYEKTNKKGIQFIDPAQFPTAFPEFIGMRPTDAKGKSFKSRDYLRKGQELYILVQAMKTGYEQKMMPKSHISFEQALNGPILQHSTVFNFMTVLEGYVPKTAESGLAAKLQSTEKVRASINEKFEGSKLGFNLEAEIKPGIFAATIMDYPIVVRRDLGRKKFEIFARDVYEDANGDPNKNDSLAEIPMEGGKKLASDAVNQIKRKIEDEMNRRMNLFAKNSKKNPEDKNEKSAVEFLGGLNFKEDDGYWHTTMKYTGTRLVPGEHNEFDVRVRPGETGESLDIINTQGDTVVY
ncbi:MAG: hypothetical protein ABIH78_03245, partial [Candidatus Peregrinibacteria bacterium]